MKTVRTSSGLDLTFKELVNDGCHTFTSPSRAKLREEACKGQKQCKGQGQCKREGHRGKGKYLRMV